MCVGVLPGALVPLWQLLQVPITSVWATVRTGDQALVVWQLAQAVVVLMCVADLPVALVPLWQLTQVPVTFEWLKLAGVHAVVE